MPQIEAVNQRSVEIQPEIETAAEIKTESEAPKPDVADASETEAPVVQPEPKIVPSRVVRKKEPRESRTERLRRAERILTGI